MFELYFSNRLPFLNIHSRTSRRIYRLVFFYLVRLRRRERRERRRGVQMRMMSCDGLEVEAEDDGFGGGGSGGWIWGGVCHVMDLGWVRRMSCDGFGVVCVM